MRSRIWQLAGVGLLSLGVSLAALAQGPGEGQQDPNGSGHGGRGSPLNSRDEVRQTQQPRQGHYQDIPRRQGDNRHWEAGTAPQRPGGNWAGRPDGRGTGWAPGPQFRPGHTVDRFPDRHWTVPYHGQNYFYSGGYWYRPHGTSYIVVSPPYGVRIAYLPPYAQEVWAGGTLFFLVADTYYRYEPASQDYVVVNPPMISPGILQTQQQGNSYDVIAQPLYGQGPDQQEQDRFQCHRWAVSQSGFDPATATYAPPLNVSDNYRRALASCLSGRGYSTN